MGLKPGPKPIAKSTGKPDQRRRDNKDTPGNTPGLKPSKSTGKYRSRVWRIHLYPYLIKSVCFSPFSARSGRWLEASLFCDARQE
ncbi:hypothetical protein GOX97_09100 [Raoultella ornithinolytica]|nr:hypothetical protein [Raoultella ornithinolytica]MXQ22534.1 hypothetical protein [Raoultella ornithinolytica]